MNGARPEVVTLCGSTRFYDAFQQANYDLTMQGKIVLSVGFYPHAKAEHGHGEGVGHDSAEPAPVASSQTVSPLGSLAESGGQGLWVGLPVLAVVLIALGVFWGALSRRRR
jgi:hypothetical protein